MLNVIHSTEQFENNRAEQSHIGLTATPGRGSELLAENTALANLFGRKLIKSKILGDSPIKFLQERGVLARLDRSSITTGIEFFGATYAEDDESGYDISVKTLREIAANTERNNIILSLLSELSLDHKSVLVFSCTSMHAEEIALLLALKGIPAASITYKTNYIARSKIIQSFKKNNTRVLVNCGVLTTGFDAPGVDAVVITRPTTSIVLYSQMLGRGLSGKSVGGSNSCQIFDIRDNFESFGDLDDVYNYFPDYWTDSAK